MFVNNLSDDVCDEAKFLLGNTEVQRVEAKVNSVCRLLVETMTELGRDKYLLSIITCYTKLKPSGLKDILEIVKELKAGEVGKAPHMAASGEKKREVTADEALEYTCWLVKADHLYDVTLQTYDINMVLQVAKHTQKDPKEYLPYLKALQELEPIYRKFKIQKDLKQYSLALAELAQVIC